MCMRFSCNIQIKFLSLFTQFEFGQCLTQLLQKHIDIGYFVNAAPSKCSLNLFESL